MNTEPTKILGFPALERFADRMNDQAKGELMKAVGKHGASTVYKALAWEEGLDEIRRPLIRRLVRLASFEIVSAGTGASTMEIMRDLSDAPAADVSKAS